MLRRGRKGRASAPSHWTGGCFTLECPSAETAPAARVAAAHAPLRLRGMEAARGRPAWRASFKQVPNLPFEETTMQGGSGRSFDVECDKLDVDCTFIATLLLFIHV
eukprot:353890-Chlamydomonas_euryale.AAC.7